LGTPPTRVPLNGTIPYYATLFPRLQAQTVRLNHKITGRGSNGADLYLGGT